jgi:3-hydroxyacyl-[acyl-carrier-protein] dehydratase
MVDRLTGLSLEPVASLRAQKYISANDPIFDGHFPGLALWPGAMTWEGMGQTAGVLISLLEIWKPFKENGISEQEFCRTLIDMEQNLTLRPNQKPKHQELFEKVATPKEGMPVGVAGSVNIKFIAPIYAGSRLDYEAVLTRRMEQKFHFQLQAKVDGKPVAKGTMVSAIHLSTFG